MKKKSVLYGLLSLVVALATLFGITTPAYADTLVDQGNMCSGSQCLNLTLGQLGGDVQFWQHTVGGEPNNDWNFWTVTNHSDVNCNAKFPFALSPEQCTALGVNGDMVLKVAFAPNGNGSGYCLWAGQYTAGNNSYLPTNKCSPTGDYSANTFLFVWTSQGYLMSAFATSVTNGHPLYVGACPIDGGSTANGEPICLTASNPVAWNFYSRP